MQYDKIQYDHNTIAIIIQYNEMQGYPKQDNTMQYNKIQLQKCNTYITLQYNTIQ